MNAAALSMILLAMESAAVPLPEAVRGLVPAGHAVLDAQSADLDGDGSADYLVVTEAEGGEEEGDHLRSMLVITTPAGAVPRIRARSDRAVRCRECGGMMGDPFQSVSARPGEFTIAHYGGSARRWSEEFTFRYSRKERAWSLVKAVLSAFHASDPEEGTTDEYHAPRDFDGIDLRDFDPDDFLRKAR
jgi:hypothetical protein